MKNIGLILFDIDGVIRSVENSYRLSLKKTVYKFSGWEPSYLDIDNAKNEGIWNNDWDLSLELIKRKIKKENLNLKIPSREEIVKDTPDIIETFEMRKMKALSFYPLPIYWYLAPKMREHNFKVTIGGCLLYTSPSPRDS